MLLPLRRRAGWRVRLPGVGGEGLCAPRLYWANAVSIRLALQYSLPYGGLVTACFLFRVYRSLPCLPCPSRRLQLAWALCGRVGIWRR
jgi:hypothetical protein